METENPQPSPSTVTRGEEADDASYYVEKLTIEEALLPEYVEDEDEELGEEGIAALHEMVAPFCKKDAPAVLMEAIGYIKFLHDQIAFCMNESEIKPPPDLRTRGLCLVPLSRTDYNSSQESSNDY